MTDQEIGENLRVLMRFIADLRVEIETFRVCLRSLGKSDEEIDAIRQALQRQWKAQTDPLVEQLRDQRSAEALRKLLEGAEGPPQ